MGAVGRFLLRCAQRRSNSYSSVGRPGFAHGATEGQSGSLPLLAGAGSRGRLRPYRRSHDGALRRPLRLPRLHPAHHHPRRTRGRPDGRRLRTRHRQARRLPHQHRPRRRQLRQRYGRGPLLLLFPPQRHQHRRGASLWPRPRRKPRDRRPTGHARLGQPVEPPRERRRRGPRLRLRSISPLRHPTPPARRHRDPRRRPSAGGGRGDSLDARLPPSSGRPRRHRARRGAAPRRQARRHLGRHRR